MAKSKRQQSQPVKIKKSDALKFNNRLLATPGNASDETSRIS